MGKLKGIIYKIENVKSGKIYVGATSRKLMYRRAEHKYNAFRRKQKYEMYADMREIGFEKFEWEIVEEVENAEELMKREKYWIAELKAEYNDRSYVKSIAVLKEEEVKVIKMLVGTMHVKEIAEIYDVAVSTINNIKYGYSWKHVS